MLAERILPAEHELPKPGMTQLVPQTPHLVGVRMNQCQCDPPWDDGRRCLRVRGHDLLYVLVGTKSSKPLDQGFFMYFFSKGVFSGKRARLIGLELQAARCRWGGGRSSRGQFRSSRLRSLARGCSQRCCLLAAHQSCDRPGPADQKSVAAFVGLVFGS